MKFSRSLLSCAALILSVVLAQADVTLVQEIKTEGSSPSINGQITIRAKDSKIRMDMPEQNISLIIDNASGAMTTVMHQQKQYLSVPAEFAQMMKQAMESAKAQAGSDADMQLEPTGKKEVINGFNCEEYTLKTKDLQAVVWLAKDVPGQNLLVKEFSRLSGEADPYKGMFSDYEKLPGFPIRTIVNDPTVGKMTITVVSVSTDAVAESEFQPPAGYKAMSFGQ